MCTTLQCTTVHILRIQCKHCGNVKCGRTGRWRGKSEIEERLPSNSIYAKIN